MHASVWLSALIKFGLEEASPSQPWLAKTLELTRRYEVSFYDGAYHALALIHKGLFVPADNGYVNRVRELGSVMASVSGSRPSHHCRGIVRQDRHRERK